MPTDQVRSMPEGKDTLLCRANSGKLRSVFKLQAFLELAVGKERLKAAQAVANARVTY